VGDHLLPGLSPASARLPGARAPDDRWRRPLEVDGGVRVVASVATGLAAVFDTGVLSVRPTVDCGWDRGRPPRSEPLPEEPTDLALRAPGEAGTTWRLADLLDPKFDMSETPALSRCEAPLTTLPLKVRSGAEEVTDCLLSLLLRGLNE